ncbi:hypothetical protein HMPREF1869_00124 [Bacteroidales bacterium KA00251]|nr:hypothetical protein HMPREF1869_00124 [Bacteroidales bacterium KA00251]
MNIREGVLPRGSVVVVWRCTIHSLLHFKKDETMPEEIRGRRELQ